MTETIREDEVAAAVERLLGDLRKARDGRHEGDPVHAEFVAHIATVEHLAALSATVSEPVAWRSMEDAPGTPERPQYVLIAEDDGSVCEARITEDGWYARNNDSTDHWGGEIYPVAWMPLPEYRATLPSSGTEGEK